MSPLKNTFSRSRLSGSAPAGLPEASVRCQRTGTRSPSTSVPSSPRRTASVCARFGEFEIYGIAFSLLAVNREMDAEVMHLHPDGQIDQ